MIKCDICKEKLPKNEVYTQKYINRNGKESGKKGHQKCVEEWFENYNSTTCDICGEKLLKDKVYVQEYESKNGIRTKKGHKDCVQYWYQENYWAFNKMRKELISTLDIDQLTAQMITRLNMLHQRFKWDIITNTIKDKRDVLCRNYKTKGWNYIFAIIENEATRLNAIEKAKQREYDKTKIPDNVVCITEYKRQDNRDISKFLE